ncbi:MAG: hypothetical protein WAO69_00035 [Aestuariivita sp.]|uniref:MOSC domain-containing protein n=1 Tax=Aestuariivita sp. TaxID=1872407 RepID=UPI003BAE4A73
MTARTPANPVTAAELDAALADVLAAPRAAGGIRMLCARPKPNKRDFPDRLTLSRDGGVTGDFEMSRPWLELPDGGPDPRIQVSVMSARVLDLVWRERDYIAHPGDNIVVDMNLTEENLPTGTLLQAGTAVLRVSDVPNEGCAKWKVRCGRAAYDWTSPPDRAHLRLRGLFCSIEQDGVVTLGDALRRL